MEFFDGSNSGEYSPKLGYRFLESLLGYAKSFLPLKLLCIMFCLPKVKVFNWIMFRGRALIEERIRKIDYQGPSRCPSCESKEETINHLSLLSLTPYFIGNGCALNQDRKGIV